MLEGSLKGEALFGKVHCSVLLPGRIRLRNYPPEASYCEPSGDGSRLGEAERTGMEE